MDLLFKFQTFREPAISPQQASDDSVVKRRNIKIKVLYANIGTNFDG
jgi:hypothetical protein